MGGDIVGAVQDGFMSRYERAAPFTFAMAFANFYLVTRAAPHRIPEPSPTPWEWECRLGECDAPLLTRRWPLLVAGPGQHAAPRPEPHQPSVEHHHRAHLSQLRCCGLSCGGALSARPRAPQGAIHEAMLSTRSQGAGARARGGAKFGPTLCSGRGSAHTQYGHEEVCRSDPLGPAEWCVVSE